MTTETLNAAKKSRNSNLIGEICLYGNRDTGAGWLARTADGRMFGDGEPLVGRSCTDAVWLAADAIRQSGIKSGVVQIFAAGGERMAKADINHVPYFGDLKWEAAPMVTIQIG